MTFGLTPEGFSPKTFADVMDELEADQRGTIAADLDTSAEGLVGQMNTSFATQLAAVWELGAAVFKARDPRDATGQALVAAAAFTGTTPAPATKGKTVLRVTLAPGTTLALGSVAQVDGQADNRWVTTEVAANGGGSNADFDVQGEAQATGVWRANAGTITVIATPVTGWLAVTNPDDATPGTEAEGDAALRVRRVQELAPAETPTLAGIRRTLLDLEDAEGDPWVVAAIVAENTSSATDAQGRPPKSLEVVVQLADGLSGTSLADARQAVAEALWASKPPGIDTFGTNLGIVLDELGEERWVFWNEATEVPVWIEATLQVDPASYAGDAAVADAVVAFGTTVTMGRPVVRAKLLCALLEVAGVTDVLALTLSRDAPVPQTAANLLAEPRERLVFDTGRVAVTTL